jgi:hypothetical protein
MLYFKEMENMKEIISNLKFISNLKKLDKINTKYMYKEQDGLFTRLNRTFFYNDNRKNTLKFIQTTIQSGFEILMFYERLDKLSDKAMCVNIIQDIIQSKTGLQNLKETYSSDLQFVCNIDTILQTIDAKLKDVESNYDMIAIKSLMQQNNSPETDKCFVKSPEDCFVKSSPLQIPNLEKSSPLQISNLEKSSPVNISLQKISESDEVASSIGSGCDIEQCIPESVSSSSLIAKTEGVIKSHLLSQQFKNFKK